MTPKFRAWDEDSQKMNGNVEIYINKDKTIEVRSKDDKTIVMQFTGLKDKNGKEIYEGDIINYKYSRHTSTQFVVKYNEFQATFVVVDNHNDLVYTFRELADYIQLNSLEVIGNIYENKELLGE